MQGAGHVGFADHVDQAVAVDGWQAADLVARHHERPDGDFHHRAGARVFQRVGGLRKFWLSFHGAAALGGRRQYKLLGSQIEAPCFYPLVAWRQGG